MSETEFYVCIVEDEGYKPSKVMGPMSQRTAERVASGASINLNWERFHVSTFSTSQLPKGWAELADG